MCQYDSRCPTRRHRPATVCPYTGRQAGGSPVLATIAAVVLAAVLGVFLVSNGALDELKALGERGTSREQGKTKNAGDDKGESRSARRLPGCQVSRVIDGDTFWCHDGRKVRLLGVNAPELAHDGRAQECHAKTSKQALTRMVDGHRVTLTSDPGQNTHDTYGRVLAYAATPTTSDVSVHLVQRGDAHARTSKPALARADQLAAAERTARAQTAGLWGYCH